MLTSNSEHATTTVYGLKVRAEENSFSQRYEGHIFANRRKNGRVFIKVQLLKKAFDIFLNYLWRRGWGRIQPYGGRDYGRIRVDLLVMEVVVDDAKKFVVEQVDDDVWR